MYCGQTGPLSGVIEASQLVIPQCQVPVTPFHIGARALEDLGESACYCLECVLLSRAQRAQGPTGRKQRVRRRSASARIGAPAVTVRVEATRSR
jgi:hypothetical protein